MRGEGRKGCTSSVKGEEGEEGRCESLTTSRQDFRVTECDAATEVEVCDSSKMCH